MQNRPTQYKNAHIYAFGEFTIQKSFHKFVRFDTELRKLKLNTNSLEWDEMDQSEPKRA